MAELTVDYSPFAPPFRDGAVLELTPVAGDEAHTFRARVSGSVVTFVPLEEA